MSTILLGYENSNGSMTDKRTGELIQWDNMIIHVMTDDRAEVCGWFCDHIKCKTKNVDVIGAVSLESLLYKPVYLQYDITAKEPTISAIIAAPSDPNTVYPTFHGISPAPAGKDK